MFILTGDHIDRELDALKSIELKFALSSEFSEFFGKIPVRILFDVLLCVLKASSNALIMTTSFIKF